MYLNDEFKRDVRQYHLRLGQRQLPYGMGGAWIGKRPAAEAVAALEHAYACGYRYFDTSVAYGDSETWVGKFVAKIDRSDIFLATKSPVPADVSGPEAGETVRRNLEQSLRRLNTDYLDLFQLHDVSSLDNTFAERGALSVLTEAKKEGLIRYYGLATRSPVLLETATRRGDFDTILTFSDYTPIDRSARLVIGVAAMRGVGVINASPLASGLLAGSDPREMDAHHHTRRRRELAAQFYDLCAQHGVSPVAAALQFPFKQPRIDMNLTGPATAEEVQAGLDAMQAPIPRAFWKAWGVVGGNTSALSH